MDNNEEAYQTPFSVTLDSVLIKTSRYFTAFQIAPIVSELSIYEHLDKPYLTASMVVADVDAKFDAASEINILGTERVEVEYSVSSAANGKVKKNFIVSEVSRQAKDVSGNEVMFIEMIEDHAYRSSLMRVSKSYRDTRRNIIDKLILTTGRRIRSHDEMLDHDDKITRVLVPNMTPLQAANWVKDSITTEDGYPFYMYSTIADDVIRLYDLKTMLELQPLNKALNSGAGRDAHFTFSQFHDFADDTISDSRAPFLNMLTITKLNVVQDQRQLHLARQGMTRSKYNFFDVTTGKNTKVDFSMAKVFSDLETKGLLKDNSDFSVPQLSPTYDQTVRLDEDNILTNDYEGDEYMTREITQFSTSRQFNDYYDTRSYSEARTAQQHENKIKSTALRHWLLKSSMDIVCGGKFFVHTNRNHTIGNKISVVVKSSRNFEASTDFNQTIDLNKSGEYLVYSAKHTISGNQSYKVELTLAKLGGLTSGASV